VYVAETNALLLTLLDFPAISLKLVTIYKKGHKDHPSQSLHTNLNGRTGLDWYWFKIGTRPFLYCQIFRIKLETLSKQAKRTTRSFIHICI